MPLCSERSFTTSLDLFTLLDRETRKWATEATFLLGYSKKIAAESTGWLCPSASFRTSMAQWVLPQIKTGILNRNSPWIWPTKRRAGSLNASGHSSFPTILPFLLATKLQRNLLSVNSQNVHRAAGFVGCVPKHIAQVQFKMEICFSRNCVLSRGKCFLHRSLA